MIKRLRQLWNVRPVLTSAFLLACALTLFFAGATVWRSTYWVLHQQEPVSGWMTVGYIGKSWGLDPREIDAVAGLPLPKVKGYPQPLSEIAKDRDIPVEDIIEDVEAAIETLRARQAQTEEDGEDKGTGGANP